MISNHLSADGTANFQKTSNCHLEFQKTEGNAPYCVAPLSLALKKKTLRIYTAYLANLSVHIPAWYVSLM